MVKVVMLAVLLFLWGFGGALWAPHLTARMHGSIRSVSAPGRGHEHGSNRLERGLRGIVGLIRAVADRDGGAGGDVELLGQLVALHAGWHSLAGQGDAASNFGHVPGIELLAQVFDLHVRSPKVVEC